MVTTILRSFFQRMLENPSTPIAGDRLLSCLQQARLQEEFYLHFQPIIATGSRQSAEVITFEALSRWYSPKLGMVSPNCFIPLMQEPTMLALFGEWVIRKACESCALWQRSGHRSRVAVNVSVRQLHLPSFTEMVVRSLEEFGLRPDMLTIEITENDEIVELDYLHRVLTKLKELGVSIGIDDFDTGYATFVVLRHFPVDILKLDTSLIQDAVKDWKTREIVAASVQLAHRLNIQVVGEGVETEAEYNLLRSLDCDYMQGYLLGKPMAAREVTGFIAAQHHRWFSPSPDSVPSQVA